MNVCHKFGVCRFIGRVCKRSVLDNNDTFIGLSITVSAFNFISFHSVCRIEKHSTKKLGTINKKMSDMNDQNAALRHEQCNVAATDNKITLVSDMNFERKVADNQQTDQSPSIENENSSSSDDDESNETDESSFSHDIPFVPHTAFKILNSIGYGRNGCVFMANWQGQHVALKQFDVSKGGYECYISELKAYMDLKEAWGELVVKPLFVSESWTGIVVFIGLQLGRSPCESDVSFSSERAKVLHRLVDEYGFDHKDACECDFVYIPGSSGDVKEKLVAIDLEDPTLLCHDGY